MYERILREDDVEAAVRKGQLSGFPLYEFNPAVQAGRANPAAGLFDNRRFDVETGDLFERKLVCEELGDTARAAADVE